MSQRTVELLEALVCHAIATCQQCCEERKTPPYVCAACNSLRGVLSVGKPEPPQNIEMTTRVRAP